MWKVVYWGVFAVLERVAMGDNAVSNHYISATKNGVVADRLCQYVVVYFDVRLFAFHDDVGRAVVVECHYVGTLRHGVDVYGVLLGYLLRLKTTLRTHILHHMAAYPLLGSKHKPSASNLVEYLGTTSCSASRAKVYGWIVELRIVHGCICLNQDKGSVNFGKEQKKMVFLLVEYVLLN